MLFSGCLGVSANRSGSRNVTDRLHLGCQKRTLGEAVWNQLGELRLFSVGEISESGRGVPHCIFSGDAFGVPLQMRRGWTWGIEALDMAARERRGGIGRSTYRLRCHAKPW